MADNVAITAGAGTTVATDDVGGVHVQRVKVQHGTDGSATDVSSASPMPVTAPTALDVLLTTPATKQLTNTVIDIASSGDNEIIAAVSGQTTRIHTLVLIPAAAVDVILKRGSTALTGTLRLTANQGLALSFQQEPHFVTAANEAFNINLSSAVSVDGWVQSETSA